MSKSRAVKAGDFLLSNSMSFGRPYILKVDGAIHDGWLAIQNYEKTFQIEYLYYVLSTDFVLNQYKSLAAGSSVLNLNKQIVAKVNIPLPYKKGSPDLETQTLIAQKLSDMDSLIAVKEELLAKKRNLKTAAMRKLFKAEDSENWKKVKLGEIAIFLATNTLSRDFLTEKEGDILNIHYGDVLIKYDSILNTENESIPRIGPDINKTFTVFAKDGDIIMADTAEDETVGKVCELQNIGGKEIVSGLHTFWIRFTEGLFVPRYLGYYLNSSSFHNQLLPFMHGTKVTSISKGDVKSAYIYLPYKNGIPDFNAQHRIASILSDMDYEITSIEKEVENFCFNEVEE